MPHRLGDGPSSHPGGWLGEYTSPDGLITLSIDEENYDFHIDARPGYRPSLMKSVLLMARQTGFDLLDEDEGDPEILDDDTIRIYLAPRPSCTPLLKVAA
ncbi:hypothetical protein [Streptomyces sp. NPDC092295]|uniref:hypothetical protein n=1 Tax=Streptomyces sp. NPDC092295 TaxID=3366011 RepID=UPI0037F499C7